MPRGEIAAVIMSLCSTIGPKRHTTESDRCKHEYSTVSPVTVSSQWRSLCSATRHYSWHRALCEISSDSCSGICRLAISWLWISQFNALTARFCKRREERVPSTVRVTQQTALHSWLETHVRIRSLEDLRQTWAPSANRRRISPLRERSGLRTLGCVTTSTLR